MSVACQVTDSTPIPEVPPLTQAQRELVKATAPILAQNGLKITSHFYTEMIGHHPELRNVFNHTAQETLEQPAALAGAVYAYAANIDDLTPILPVVERICHKHATLNIRPHQYHIVGVHLLQAIKDVLGDAFTQELFDVWYNAYWQLARICIDREAELYHKAGWVGWKPFKVEKRVQESGEITSFYFVPEDTSLLPLPSYEPGQFISVRKFVPKLGSYQNRQYSLSDTPNKEHFRISVRRDPGVPHGPLADPTKPAPPGWISNLLHDTFKEGDTIELSAPFGDSFFGTTYSPVIFLSAGVGLTPVLSMLNTLFAGQKAGITPSQVSWIHCSRNKSSQAFGDHIRTLAEKNPQTLHTVVFYSQPDQASIKGQDYQIEGRLDLAKVPEADLHLDNKTAQYYVCGPVNFMGDMSKALISRGVEADRIHMEVFGAESVPR